MAEATATQVVSTEIDQLKAVTRCKVMKNVGDFMFLIDASIPNTEALIKFQLSAKYPEEAPEIFIKHPLMSKDDIRKLMMSLPEDTKKMLELFHLIKSYINEKHPLSTVTGHKQASPPSPRDKKKKSKQLADEGTEATKKPSMRTAADVIKRMQWDSSLDREACIVGYVDRFMGIQEQPFNSFNWVNPAEADWMDLNIPEHRIEYFKYKDVIVWEKKSRIDNVFGSTGGQTIDQLLSADEPLATNVVEDGDSLKATEKTPPASTVHTNPSKHAQKAKPMDKDDRDKPNHFIAIPVTEEGVVKIVDEIQDQYLTLSDSDGAENRKELYNLHVTLCALRINNQNDLDKVTEVLYNLIMDSSFHDKFTLTTLGTFWDRVLYAGVKLDDEFVKFVLKLRETLVEKGIRIFDDVNEFTPHVTIFSFPRSKSANLHLPLANYLAIRADANSHTLDHLSVPLEQVVIYSMERSDTNRYLEQVVLDLHV